MRGVGVVVWVHSASESALSAVRLVIQSAAEIGCGAARLECAIPFHSHCSSIDYGAVFFASLKVSGKEQKGSEFLSALPPYPV